LVTQDADKYAEQIAAVWLERSEVSAYLAQHPWASARRDRWEGYLHMAAQQWLLHHTLAQLQEQIERGFRFADSVHVRRNQESLARAAVAGEVVATWANRLPTLPFAEFAREVDNELAADQSLHTFVFGEWIEKPTLPLDPSSSVPIRGWIVEVGMSGVPFFRAGVGDELGMDGVHYGTFKWNVARVGNLRENLPNPNAVQGKDYGNASTLEEAKTACHRRLRELAQESS
jgi:hypothetical protein